MAICIALPIATDGRANWEEVAIPLLAGAIVLIFSFFVFLLGLIFVIKNRKKKVGNAPPANMNQYGQPR